MGILMRAEVLKLRTVRGPWLLLAAGPLLVLAGISGLVVSGGNLHDPAMQAKALAHVGLASIFPLIFGILAVAGEYRHKTITDTYLTTPARGRVIGAKLTVYPVFGVLAGAACTVVGLAVAAAWWSAKGAPFAWGDSAMWATIAGGIAWNTAFAAMGVGPGRADPQPGRRDRRRAGLDRRRRGRHRPADRQPRPLAAVLRRAGTRRWRHVHAARAIAAPLGCRRRARRLHRGAGRRGRHNERPARRQLRSRHELAVVWAAWT